MIFLITTIAVAAVAGLLGFGAGVRHAAKTLLPIWLARMTQKELNALALRAAEERKAA